MSLFRRAISWFFLLFGIVVGLVGSAALFFARHLVNPPRQRLWATPGDIGLPYEDVSFPAQDGMRLAGWFVPAGEDTSRKGATIIILHGWLWNRLGESAENLLANITSASPVDLLRLAYGLHQEGYHILMFDQRNHGESAASPPVTFGFQESNDLLGALAYLNGRTEVAPERIGAIGFSSGANTLLYTLPLTKQIKAAVAVQPTSVSTFARRLGTDLLGPLGRLAVPLTELLYLASGGPSFSEIRPGLAAASAGEIPILYVQGQGDRWGSVEDVAQMAEVSPQAHGPLVVDTADRFGGYQYPVDNPKVVAAFFEQHLPE